MAILLGEDCKQFLTRVGAGLDGRRRYLYLRNYPYRYRRWLWACGLAETETTKAEW